MGADRSGGFMPIVQRYQAEFDYCVGSEFGRRSAVPNMPTEEAVMLESQWRF